MKNPIDAHQTSGEQAEQIGQVREAFKAPYAVILTIPDTRHCSLAITNPEQSQMWLIKGICMYEKPDEED